MGFGQMDLVQLGHWQMSSLMHFKQLNTFTDKDEISPSLAKVKRKAFKHYVNASIFKKE